MRRVFFTSLLILLFAAPLANAEVGRSVPVAIHDVIEQMEDSVLLIKGITSDRRMFKGTGVVVKTDENGVTLLTAKHVADMGEIFVVHGGKSYFPITKVHLQFTDVTAVYFPPIRGAKAIKLNLDPKGGKVDSLAFGYWGKLEVLTATAGYTNRTVISEYYNAYEVIEGVIKSSSLVYFGFSGGALIDTQGRLLGINVVLTGRYTLAIDARYIWNHLAKLNMGKRISYSNNKNYNLLGTKNNGWKRIEVNLSDQIKNKKGESVSVLDLRVLCGKESTADGLTINSKITKWLQPDNTITIKDKVNKIVGFSIAIRDKIPQSKGAPSLGMQYVFVFADGYYFLLEVQEVKTEKKAESDGVAK